MIQYTQIKGPVKNKNDPTKKSSILKEDYIYSPNPSLLNKNLSFRSKTLFPPALKQESQFHAFNIS